jgi:hypothetical protein
MKRIIVALAFLACSPKFTTTPIENTIYGKAEAKSIIGSWLYTRTERAYTTTIRLDIEQMKVRYSENCVSADSETSIQTTSRANVSTGRLTLIDGVTGSIQNGSLNCGLDFAAAEYPVAVRADTLTILTPNGPINFERIKL